MAVLAIVPSESGAPGNTYFVRPVSGHHRDGVRGSGAQTVSVVNAERANRHGQSLADPAICPRKRLPPICRYATLANVRLPITDSGRMAISGQSPMATSEQNPLSADKPAGACDCASSTCKTFFS